MDSIVDSLFEVKTLFNEIKNPCLILSLLIAIKPEKYSIQTENFIENLITKDQYKDKDAKMNVNKIINFSKTLLNLKINYNDLTLTELLLLFNDNFQKILDMC